MLLKHYKTNYRLILGWILLSLIAVCFLVLATPETSYAITIEPVSKVLGGTSPVSAQIKNVWNQILVFVNSIAIVMLIFIAFANILRININSYGIKKFLPSLALAIIAANFSYLFCRILVDLANVACDLFINGVNTSGITGGFDFTSYKLTEYNQWLRILLLAILEFVGAVFIIILAFMFFIRNYMIYFLVALSPITLICMVLPLTKSVFNMWWQQFWKWTFMPVVSLFWLWIAAQWVGSLFPPGGSSGSIILAFAFAIVCYYLAITTPFKMGGAIMQQWSQAPKKYGGYGIRQVSGVGARMSYLGQNLQKQNTRGSFWHRVGTGLERTGGVVNASGSYEALKKRKANAVTNLQKATLKTGTYKRLGGRDVIIEGEKAKREDILKNMPPERTGEMWATRENAIYNDILAGGSRQALLMRQELNGLVAGGNFMHANETARRRALRLFTASEGVSNLLLRFRGLGGEQGQLRNEAEAVYSEGIVKNFLRDERGQRTRGLLGSAYNPLVPGAPLPISAVGEETEEATETQHQAQETLRNLGGDVAGTALANAALHGNGDITVNAQNLHLNMSSQAAAQAGQAFDALRGQRDALRGEEMSGHERRIDWEMNGAKIVHNGLFRTVKDTDGNTKKDERGNVERVMLGSVANQNAHLGNMGLHASVGLTNLQNGNVDAAIAEAKKLGHTNIPEGDTEVKSSLNGFFRRIQSGISDVKSQRDALGLIPSNWKPIEENLRTAKTAQAEQSANAAASARIVVQQTPLQPQVIQKLGDTTVASALEEQSGHLADLTEHLNRIAGETGKVTGAQPITFTPEQSRQTFLSSISGAGIDQGTATMSDALAQRDVQKRLAEEIANATVRAQSRAPKSVDAVRGHDVNNVTNITNTAGATPPNFTGAGDRQAPSASLGQPPTTVRPPNITPPDTARPSAPPAQPAAPNQAPPTPPASPNPEPPQPPPPFDVPKP